MSASSRHLKLFPSAEGLVILPCCCQDPDVCCQGPDGKEEPSKCPRSLYVHLTFSRSLKDAACAVSYIVYGSSSQGRQFVNASVRPPGKTLGVCTNNLGVFNGTLTQFLSSYFS